MARVYQDVRDAGALVFVAGQTPQGPSGDVPDDIGDQVVVALSKITSLLTPRGLGLADVVKVTYFLTDIRQLDQVRAALDAALPQPRPTATLVEVSSLVDPRFHVEIEAIAYRQ